MERRLDVVEGKLDSISNSLSKTRLDFFKVMIGTAGTIVVSVVSAVALVLSK